MVPQSARIRGIWFKMTADALRRRGPAMVVPFQNAGGGAARWAFLLYDAREYLVEAALAATLLNPADPREGLRAIWRNATNYSNVLHPGSFIHLLKPDPM